MNLSIGLRKIEIIMELDFLFFTKLIFRFATVGLLGVGINFGLTYVQKENLNWNKYIANLNGFVIAVCCNFLLNRFWTFHAQDQEVIPQIARFCLIAVSGALLNHYIVLTAHKYLKYNFYISKVFAVGFVFIWNLILHSTYTFKSINIY